MEVYKYHSNITQKRHGASRNYRYVLDVSTSLEERLPHEDDHILLISFVYLCQSFLISHEQSVKEGLFVILFLSRAHSMLVPSRIMGLHIRHAIPG